MEELDGREKAVQLVNRITFGPRPGDVERVEETGLAAFLEEQLHPERIDDSKVEAKLRELPTLAMASDQLVDAYPPPKLAKRSGETMIEDAAKPREILVELARGDLWRAVYGKRQLEQLMVLFWMNHFNIFAPKGVDKWLVTSFERDTIRPRVLGRFEDLLVATAKSPAMLFYLDNWLSASPRARTFLKNRRGLNENYARELMELHTVGVDGGYSQKDVTEVARAFTGWTITRPRREPEFHFAPRLHDPGEKTVLGRRIDAGGMEDGLEVLRLLASAPATARFLSRKLCARFVADDPPATLVERASRTFHETGGDVRAVLRTILTSPEFYSRAAFRAKVKSPFELVASALRAHGGETDAGRPLLYLIARMGQPMFQFQAPTGYPDRAATWVDPSGLLFRMKFAAALATDRLQGTRIRVDDDDRGRVALALASPEFQRR